MRTRFGQIEVESSHPFSRPVLGQRTSPFLQEKLIELGSDEVYGQVPGRIGRLLGIEVNQSQAYRCCQRAAGAIPEGAAITPGPAMAAALGDERGTVYAMVDGSMLQLDGGWQEVKVGRVFTAAQVPDGQGFKWDIGPSSYVAKRGHYTGFAQAFEQALPPESRCGQVFVTDGAQWIGQWIARSYPAAAHVLDLFHVCEKPAAVAPGDGGAWLEKQKLELLHSNTGAVLAALKGLPGGGEGAAAVAAYIENHRDKMDYKRYRANGWMIGSGPVEAAHRTVLQVRMKRSGQRWAQTGCDNLIKLRVIYKNNKSFLVKNALKNAA